LSVWLSNWHDARVITQTTSPRIDPLAAFAPALFLAPRRVLRLLFWLRWALLSGLLLIALLAIWRVGEAVISPQLVGLLLTAMLINIGLYGQIRHGFQSSLLSHQHWLGLHLVLDCVLITVGLFLTGGAGSAFASLYLLPIAIAAAALGKIAWGVLAVALLGYSGLIAWDFLAIGAVTHQHSPAQGSFGLHVLGMWANFLLAASLLTVFLGYMARILRARETELVAARERAIEEQLLLNLAAQAAGAAHELNTPLSSMALLVDELEREPKSEDLQTLRDQLGVCQRAIHDMVRTASERDTELVTDFLHETFEHWRIMRPEIDGRLTLNKAQGQAQDKIAVTPALRQAVTSLLNNAADASCKNGRDRIDIRANVSGANAQIIIRDFGAGFAQADVQPVEATTEQTSNGLGIGLSLARGVIERQGGMLVFSHAEPGLRCEILIPKIA